MLSGEVSSAEPIPDTEEVTGSIPVSPTSETAPGLQICKSGAAVIGRAGQPHPTDIPHERDHIGFLVAVSLGWARSLRAATSLSSTAWSS